MKERLDAAIVARGLVSGRDKAKGIIMAGQVYVDGQKADKPGQQVDENSRIEVRGETLAYVSRGGLKLEKSIETFGLALEGLVCGDIGASTGGFTDCMLQKGAARVYAVDVGYGQLAWKLRQDERVVVLEETNARYLTAEQIPEPLDAATIDAAFISLGKLLPALYPLLKPEGFVMALIKPQFEAGREKVGKKGVVRDAAVHREVISGVLDFAAETGFCIKNLEYSPIKGPEGNIEYLVHLGKGDAGAKEASADIDAVVKAAHAALD